MYNTKKKTSADYVKNILQIYLSILKFYFANFPLIFSS